MPRFAGSSPKLRPSDSLPAMTTSSHVCGIHQRGPRHRNRGQHPRPPTAIHETGVAADYCEHHDQALAREEERAGHASSREKVGRDADREQREHDADRQTRGELDGIERPRLRLRRVRRRHPGIRRRQRRRHLPFHASTAWESCSSRK
jgi:hypothetical protein